MQPATSVPVSPTISDTREPKIRRLSTSRPWKSVPNRACALPPAAQKGGSKIFAPGIGSVGSYGAITPANRAISTYGTRIASGTIGNPRASLIHSRRSLAGPLGESVARTAGAWSVVSAIVHLFGQSDAGIDVG